MKLIKKWGSGPGIKALLVFDKPSLSECISLLLDAVIKTNKQPAEQTKTP